MIDIEYLTRIYWLATLVSNAKRHYLYDGREIESTALKNQADNQATRPHLISIDPLGFLPDLGTLTVQVSMPIIAEIHGYKLLRKQAWRWNVWGEAGSENLSKNYT